MDHVSCFFFSCVMNHIQIALWPLTCTWRNLNCFQHYHHSNCNHQCPWTKICPFHPHWFHQQPLARWRASNLFSTIVWNTNSVARIASLRLEWGNRGYIVYICTILIRISCLFRHVTQCNHWVNYSIFTLLTKHNRMTVIIVLICDHFVQSLDCNLSTYLQSETISTRTTVVDHSLVSKHH